MNKHKYLAEKLLYEQFEYELSRSMSSNMITNLRISTDGNCNKNEKELTFDLKLETFYDCSGVVNSEINKKLCRNKITKSSTCCANIVSNLTSSCEYSLDDPRKNKCKYFSIFTKKINKLFNKKFCYTPFNPSNDFETNKLIKCGYSSTNKNEILSVKNENDCPLYDIVIGKKNYENIPKNYSKYTELSVNEDISLYLYYKEHKENNVTTPIVFNILSETWPFSHEWDKYVGDMKNKKYLKNIEEIGIKNFDKIITTKDIYARKIKNYFENDNYQLSINNILEWNGDTNLIDLYSLNKNNILKWYSRPGISISKNSQIYIDLINNNINFKNVNELSIPSKITAIICSIFIVFNMIFIYIIFYCQCRYKHGYDINYDDINNENNDNQPKDMTYVKCLIFNYIISLVFSLFYIILYYRYIRKKYKKYEENDLDSLMNEVVILHNKRLEFKYLKYGLNCTIITFIITIIATIYPCVLNSFRNRKIDKYILEKEKSELEKRNKEIEKRNKEIEKTNKELNSKNNEYMNLITEKEKIAQEEKKKNTASLNTIKILIQKSQVQDNNLKNKNKEIDEKNKQINQLAKSALELQNDNKAIKNEYNKLKSKFEELVKNNNMTINLIFRFSNGAKDKGLKVKLTDKLIDYKDTLKEYSKEEIKAFLDCNGKIIEMGKTLKEAQEIGRNINNAEIILVVTNTQNITEVNTNNNISTNFEIKVKLKFNAFFEETEIKINMLDTFDKLDQKINNYCHTSYGKIKGILLNGTYFDKQKSVAENGIIEGKILLVIFKEDANLQIEGENDDNFDEITLFVRNLNYFGFNKVEIKIKENHKFEEVKNEFYRIVNYKEDINIRSYFFKGEDGQLNCRKTIKQNGLKNNDEIIHFYEAVSN